MALIVKTIGGEMLDAIAHKHYKGLAGATEALLEANVGLSRLGPVLPAGIEIVLPELPEVKPEVIKLWD